MTFRINHSRVVSQANTIANLANSLTAEINRLNAMEQHLRSVWTGQTSNVFRSRVSAMRTELNMQRQQMANLAATIRRTADAIQRADEEAARRAASLR